MQNIFETGHIGLIFLVPGREETLRVNGRAWITRDPELLGTMQIQGKDPWFAIGVEVEQCFLHCAKAFKRSRLWEPESWPDLALVPSGAQILKDASGTRETLEEIEARLAEGYRLRMYCNRLPLILVTGAARRECQRWPSGCTFHDHWQH